MTGATFHPAIAEQCSRDLVWVVESPALLANLTYPNATQPSLAERYRVAASQIDSEHLAQTVVVEGQYRVGRYFERLVLYWLKFIRGVEVIRSGCAIRESGKTIGEIDVIFRDEHGRLTHWELAVKFYLQNPEISERRRSYLGPNPSDRLDRKVQRLFEHQLKLGRDYFPEVEIRQAFVKGRIFYHPSTPGSTANTNDGSSDTHLAKDHLRGNWLRANEVDRVRAGSLEQFQVLRKPFWLSSYRPEFQPVPRMDWSQLSEYCQQHFQHPKASPILISQHASQEPFTEIQRFFIVSDNWPQRSAS